MAPIKELQLCALNNAVCYVAIHDDVSHKGVQKIP